MSSASNTSLHWSLDEVSKFCSSNARASARLRVAPELLQHIIQLLFDRAVLFSEHHPFRGMVEVTLRVYLINPFTQIVDMLDEFSFLACSKIRDGDAVPFIASKLLVP